MARKKEVIDISTCPVVIASYFGVDLHKDQITWHRIEKTSGGQLIRSTGKTATEDVQKDFLPLLDSETSYLLVEASGSTFFFYAQMLSHCKQVIVVNPVAFREMFMSGKKTDRIDARKLADRLMYHIEMNDGDDNFPEVFVPDEQTIQIRKLITSYELVTKQVTQLKNQVKAVYRAKLLDVEPDVLEFSLERMLTHSRLDKADRIIISSLKSLYDSHNQEKKAIKEAILEIGIDRFQNEVKLITTVNGISVFGAIVFMADICTVARFQTAKKMTSYLATTGTVDSSGNTTRNGSLSKRGRRTSYRFILQGVEHIIHGNHNFESFKKRHKSKRTNKVRSAIIRKTFVSLFYMLKNNEPYRFMDKAIYTRKMREFKKFEKKVDNAA